MRTSTTLAFTCALFLAGCSNKKKNDVPPVPPPSNMGATGELSIGLGIARGLDERLVTSSAHFRHVFVLDDHRAVVVGDTATDAVALVTTDAGSTWRSLPVEQHAWSSWSVAADGTIVLVDSTRAGTAKDPTVPIDSVELRFAAIEAQGFNAPMPLFPGPQGPAKGRVPTTGTAAILSADIAALLVEEQPRRFSLFYGGKPGSEPISKRSLPAGETVVTMPYGRPPALLTVRGRDILTRAFPATTSQPFDKPRKITGLVASTALAGELSAAPACDAGPWSFQLVKQGSSKLGTARLGLVAASATKSVSLLLPDVTALSTPLGCSESRVVVDATSTTPGNPPAPALLVCDLEGKCQASQNPPFRLWPEPHEHELVMTPTDKGVVAVLSAHTGERWGLYLAQSEDSLTYERPRVIGEGSGQRGRIELGALVAFGKRVLLLISADVVGTSRRGWFTIASDDGGTTWNPP